jgi:two-component system, NtrC family, response regulator GlrR
MDSETTGSVTMPGDSIAAISVREWSVEVISGPDKGKRFCAQNGLVRVGTDATNDIALSDTTVSRKHLEIEHTPQGLLLRDVGSRNGTLLAGRRVLQAFVEPRDKIDLGRTRLVIEQDLRSGEVAVDGLTSFGGLLGASESMRLIFADLRRASLSEASLLIEGETGTGKELAARAVHAASLKRFGPFRVVDCAFLSSENLEQELFSNHGALLGASGGVLFFDEVAELPLAAQTKLLRAFETKTLPDGRPFDARLIFCTARNLPELALRGTFKPEFVFRIAGVRTRLPPLRARKSDILLLARHFLSTQSTKLELSQQVLSLLEGYDWPGNVRELRNMLERGALMQSSGNLSWLSILASPSAPSLALRENIEATGKLPYHEAKERILSDFERNYFAEVMRACEFDFGAAERRTGLSIQSLYRLLKKNGLNVKHLKTPDVD